MYTSVPLPGRETTGWCTMGPIADAILRWEPSVESGTKITRRRGKTRFDACWASTITMPPRCKPPATGPALHPTKTIVFTMNKATSVTPSTVPAHFRTRLVRERRCMGGLYHAEGAGGWLTTLRYANRDLNYRAKHHRSHDESDYEDHKIDPFRQGMTPTDPAQEEVIPCKGDSGPDESGDKQANHIASFRHGTFPTRDGTGIRGPARIPHSGQTPVTLPVRSYPQFRQCPFGGRRSRYQRMAVGMVIVTRGSQNGMKYHDPTTRGHVNP